MGLEREFGCDLDLTRRVKEAAVVRVGDGAKRRRSGLTTLIGCRTGTGRGGQFVAEVADTVDVLMVGDVEDIRDELKLGPLLDGDLLLDTDIVDDTARPEALSGLCTICGIR